MLTDKSLFRVMTILMLITPISAIGQEDLAIACRRWDDAFISSSYIATIVLAVLALAATWLSGRFARVFPGRWMRVRPWFRAVCVFIFCATLSWTVVVLVPRFYLGGALWAAVDPAYRECANLSFGAAGLLAGRIGAGTVAYTQTLALSSIAIGLAFIGTVMGWLLGRWKAHRTMKTS